MGNGTTDVKKMPAGGAKAAENERTDIPAIIDLLRAGPVDIDVSAIITARKELNAWRESQ